MKKVALEIKNLSVEFDVRGQKVNAVSDVSWNVKKGETLAIVGESGSGKSTTARVITGLLPQTVGSVEFDGKFTKPIGRLSLKIPILQDKFGG